MPTPNPPEEDRPIDEPVPNDAKFESDDAPLLMSGPGISVVLSVAFYLIVLAGGIGYDHAHRLRSPQSNAPDPASADWLASVHVPIFPLMPFEAIAPIRILLAQAHDCAQAGRWDCVDSATHAAMALRGGDLSETQRQREARPDGSSLLAQASASEMKGLSRATFARPGYRDHGERLKVADHVRTPHDRWHPYRHTGTTTLARRATVRPASPELLADLYRH